MLYGFPPNVGAVGTAALLDVPNSLENLLRRLDQEGYDVGDFARDPDASGQSLVAALSILCENSVIAAGADKMQTALEQRMERARNGDNTVAEALGLPGTCYHSFFSDEIIKFFPHANNVIFVYIFISGGGIGGATVRGTNMRYVHLVDCIFYHHVKSFIIIQMLAHILFQLQ